MGSQGLHRAVFWVKSGLEEHDSLDSDLGMAVGPEELSGPLHTAPSGKSMRITGKISFVHACGLAHLTHATENQASGKGH